MSSKALSNVVCNFKYYYAFASQIFDDYRMNIALKGLLL